MARPDPVDLPLLRALHALVFSDPDVGSALDRSFDDLAVELARRPEPPYAAGTVPIELFLDGLPADSRDRVRQCRTFLLRRGRKMEAPEIHRNSIQRLVSYRGRGRIHAGSPGTGPEGLTPRAIRSPSADDRGGLERFWDVVPASTWHYPEAGARGDWATVTFHSASAREIQEEVLVGPLGGSRNQARECSSTLRILPRPRSPSGPADSPRPPAPDTTAAPPGRWP